MVVYLYQNIMKIMVFCIIFFILQNCLFYFLINNKILYLLFYIVEKLSFMFMYVKY